jgi:hypothetical protein
MGMDDHAAEVDFEGGFSLPLTSGVKIGSSEKDVLLAYGVPDRVVQQPMGKLFIYNKRGVLMWVGDGKVVSFAVFKSHGPHIGVGIYVGKKDDRVVVFKVMSESPAESAGLQPGDELREIDGMPVGGNLDVAANGLRGDVDAVVKIKVRKENGTEVELALPRRPIKES